MDTQQIKVDPGKKINWRNTSGETLALRIVTADGAEISINILHGHSAQIISGSEDITVNIDPCDDSLVGIPNDAN